MSTGADATGDGVQATADFSAIQVNFFKVGEPLDACPADGGLQRANPPDLSGPGLEKARPVSRLSVPVDDLTFENAYLADMNGDGVVDGRDIRAFAQWHGLELLPEFSAKLERFEREAKKIQGIRSLSVPGSL